MPNVAIKNIPHVEVDTKQEILDKLGDLSGVEISQNQFIMAIYFRPEMTPGGIVMPPSYLKEDEYQGKVGLVVKIGSACRFVHTDEKTGVTYGVPIALHDWVVVRVSDSWPLDINAHPNILRRDEFVKCRLVFDDCVRLKVPHPGMIW